MAIAEFILSTLVSAAPVLGLLLSFLLFFNRKDNTSGAVRIALFLFIFSVILLWNEFSTDVLGNEYPLFLRLMGPFLTLVGPGLYFSLRSLLEKDFRHHWWDFLHFIPFLFYFLHLSAFYIHDIGFLASNTDNGSLLGWLWFGLLIHYLVYFVLSLNKLRLYSVKLKEVFSNTESYDLGWLVPVLAGFLLLVLLEGFLLMGLHFRHIDARQLNRSLSLAFSVFIYYPGVKVLMKKKQWEPLPEIGEKKRKKALSDSDKEKALKQILALMKDRKPYLDPELSLPQLADICSMTPHKLSEVLNSSGTIFYDFVNRYRVEEFIRLVSVPENDRYTLLALALDAGFSSKTTFNTVVKKLKGQTPSQIKKQVQSARVS